MTLSTSLIASSRRLIQTYGQSISFARVVEGTFVPSTGAVGAGTTSSYTAYGCPMATPDAEINGTTVLQGDLIVWVERNTSNSVPAIGDVATIAGQAYRVLAVSTPVISGSNIAYKLQVRI